MLSGFGGAALALLAGYLLLFFWGSALAAQAADRPVWLFGQARGRDRWAAFGFPAAFALAFLGPLLWLVWPALHKSDPFWTEGEAVALGLTGIFISGTGAMLAFAAQMSMGSSWRVGVAKGATGALVSGGLYRFSRNPTFVGQFMLLAGVSLAIPAVPTFLASLLFLWSAATQVRSEEIALQQALGSDYDHYLKTVPRWIGFQGRTMPWRAALTAVLIAAILLADQATKAAALSLLSPGQTLPVVPGFDLTLSFNEGASFGMMSGVMTGRPLLMAALTGGLALIFAVMAFRAKSLPERTGFSLIVGGALGNIIDRLRQGAVTDFFSLYWNDWYWPTFNGADIAITLGALSILIATFTAPRKEPLVDHN